MEDYLGFITNIVDTFSESGAEHLPPPNWKEKKQLGDKLDEGFRLICQLWIKNDIELRQEKVTEQA